MTDGRAFRHTPDTGIDFTRVIACYMIVVLHVSAINFPVMNGKWWPTNFYDSFVRCSVPLFLMISGALLLTREESLDRYLRKRFVRVLPPLVFWSLFYMVWAARHGANYGGTTGWIAAIARGPVSYHLWYLYLIVGIYLFVPFLRKIYLYSSATEKEVFLLIWIAFASIWPICASLLKIKVDVVNTYGLGSFAGYIGYVFLGAFLFDYNQACGRSAAFYASNSLLYVGFSAVTMAVTYLHSLSTGSPSELFYTYLSPFVLLAAIGAFNLLYALGKKTKRYAREVQFIAVCTLGIYCLHIFVLDRLSETFGLSGATGSPWWSIPITSAVVFVVSFAVIGLMRTLKIFRRVT